jgi:hypothetical protein
MAEETPETIDPPILASLATRLQTERHHAADGWTRNRDGETPSNGLVKRIYLARVREIDDRSFHACHANTCAFMG